MTSGHLSTMHYEAGETVNGKYDILEPLGQGGMNDAYKARDRESGRLVVLKIPFKSLIGDPATFSRYQRELEIGKRLHHPNIQQLLDQARLELPAPLVVQQDAPVPGLRGGVGDLQVVAAGQQ